MVSYQGMSKCTDGELKERMTSHLTLACEDSESDTEIQESSPSRNTGTQKDLRLPLVHSQPPHCIQRETEAQSRCVTSPESHSKVMARQGPERQSPISSSVVLTLAPAG